MNLFKSETQIIAEIHEAFDSAQDRLLSEANRILSAPVVEVVKGAELASRLKTVGFTQTPIVQRVDKQLSDKAERTKVLVATREQAELIQYYKRTYPFMKFLTESELDRICDKYNLIHAPVGNFIGEVPEKNLGDIERAQKLNDSDVLPDTYLLKYNSYRDEQGRQFLSSIGVINNTITVKQFEQLINNYAHRFSANMVPVYKQRGLEENTWLYLIASDPKFSHFDRCVWGYDSIEKTTKEGLFIAAPSKDFNTKGLTKKGKHWFNVLRTEVKDPIVFRYVRGGIQVITKWGLEASDAVLVNEIDN